MLKGGFSFAAAMFTLMAVSCAQTRLVKQQVTHLEPYCGGARPTEEMVAEAQKPKPYAHRMIILINGGKTDSAKTNEAGIFSKKLKPGTYRLFEAWRYYKVAPGGGRLTDFDRECLVPEWSRAFGVLTVTRKGHSFEPGNVITRFCDHRLPCYSGHVEPPQ